MGRILIELLMTIPSQECVMKPCYSNITLPAECLKELREEGKKQETNFNNLISKVQEEDKKRGGRQGRPRSRENFKSWKTFNSIK